MKEITLFYLEHCPYCAKAKRALNELGREEPAYASVRIQWIEESRQSALAGQYDYYYVPALFHGDKKLYEANPAESYEDIKAKLKAALDAVLSEP